MGRLSRRRAGHREQPPLALVRAARRPHFVARPLPPDPLPFPPPAVPARRPVKWRQSQQEPRASDHFKMLGIDFIERVLAIVRWVDWPNRKCRGRILAFARPAQGSGTPNERPPCCLRSKKLSAVAGFSLYPKFWAIPGSGANGGSGEADLAISYRSKAPEDEAAYQARTALASLPPLDGAPDGLDPAFRQQIFDVVEASA